MLQSIIYSIFLTRLFLFCFSIDAEMMSQENFLKAIFPHNWYTKTTIFVESTKFVDSLELLQHIGLFFLCFFFFFVPLIYFFFPSRIGVDLLKILMTFFIMLGFYKNIKIYLPIRIGTTFFFSSICFFPSWTFMHETKFHRLSSNI